MVNKILLALFVSGALVSGYAVAQPGGGDGGKNLKILPKTMSKKEIKDAMKKIAKALGVQCEHCHDTNDFAKDTEKKNVARSMMKMTGELNKTYFKGEMKVQCVTCHRG